MRSRTKGIGRGTGNRAKSGTSRGRGRRKRAADTADQERNGFTLGTMHQDYE